MTTVEAQVLTDAGNNAVVRLPGRRFPAVLLQGDSLHILLESARDAQTAVANGAVHDAKAALASLVRTLSEMTARYEQALTAHGFGRPF